jgi:hypothetical protein
MWRVRNRHPRRWFLHSLALIASGVAGWIASYRFWRPRCLGWGATAGEMVAPQAGDDLLPVADIVSTRAVAIRAPASEIWPWLVQMGPGRGGAYTYDWIENIFGLGMHSANEILPEHQHLEVGFALTLGRRGPVLRVASLEPLESLVFRSDDGNWVWAFALAPAAGGVTRLISRNRIATPGAIGPLRAFNRYVMEPGSLIMERKMLLGIRQRAENHFLTTTSRT